MKIERITVCNIASLAGTHSVDFTKDPLRTAGLFSISGATGAGKSTLLDALCLALFDQTPRLNLVGRLAELTSGERQNDTRMLLRRNTAYGFAEVAFVGVDQQQWTARWSVRRSHNKPDGNLQQVEMALYRGHIAPGGEGVVAEGGKKTLVKEAIIEKIGLTFEQFTRAVLLAQNDFATFLKADDKQRAEILQALTGTEHFEAISRAVFVRYANEKKAVETLEAQLQGFRSLSDEARAEADVALLSATSSVKQLEVNLKEHEARAEWFRQHAALVAAVEQAKAALTAAVGLRDASSTRRAELQLTENVSHAARALRDDEVRAVKAVDAARTALESADTALKSHTESLKADTDRVVTATAALNQAQEKQSAAAPQLKLALELDAQLEPLQLRVKNAHAALTNAVADVKDATTKRDESGRRKQALLDEQQKLESRRSKLMAYVPFVKEVATWQHRLNTAITAGSEATELRDKQMSLTDTLRIEQQELQTKRDDLLQVQQQLEAAAGERADAETAERQFDGERLAQQRVELDASQRVLRTLQQELADRHKLRADADSLGNEIGELESQQTQDATTLKQLQDVDVPAAVRDAQVSRDQLERIVAAVDDAAKRLRLSLQPDQPCPVCGSESHPYSDHAPDFEATAVKAAKDHCKELETRRDRLNNEVQRLVASLQSRREQITRQQKVREKLLKAIDSAVFSSVDHAEVATVLAFPDVERQSVVTSKLDAVAILLRQIAADEKAQRVAAKLTQTCRERVDKIAATHQSLQHAVTELEKQTSITATKHAGSESVLKKADETSRDALAALSGLFSALPTAKDEFTADAAGFRDTFITSTRSCGEIQEQLHELTTNLLAANATIEPLEEAMIRAGHALKACEIENAAAVGVRDKHLQQRQQLFDGRAVDVVQQEFAARLTAAGQTVDELTAAKHAAEKLLAAAEETYKSAKKNAEQTTDGLKTAQATMSAWLESFNAGSSRTLTIADVDQMLARDAAWFETERTHFKSLDERVTSTSSACDVHQHQLQQHVDKRPAPDDEAVVLEAEQRVKGELEAAKNVQEAAQDVIKNDDRQRNQNTELTQRLAEQLTVAEPWLKLNELIGSKEGDKFRMIAQRRTLDVLLGYANHQLTQLSARYRLERLPESLNLIVIDCDMGEERRSVHSLSGGESFLVSLALALGLASLTSNRLRIESLFIDEGFGSLDLETLTTAMNALTHLEAQGRKVGVISHVTEMTDAIPVQIRIEKRRQGGASRIVIPGADPDWVNPTTSFEAASKSSSSKSEDSDAARAVAATILKVLKREQLQGNHKVSTTALRKEIGCRVKDFASAQVLLDGQIIVDGRSLRLTEG
ncbi:MAG: AAA family ATPase [Fuerstia sp.]|nr:AAA family ATPase [Fuerstiella sp.]